MWDEETDSLIFSDNGTSRRYQWSEAGGLSVVRTDTGHANGLARDWLGRIVACEHSRRRVTRDESDGTVTVVANRYRGRRLNRPNDVIVDSDGAIYFTDPMTLGVENELDFSGVYRVSPDLGEIHVLVDDLVLPNGIVMSPDEQTLYVNDSRRMHIRSFAIDRWATREPRLDLSTDRVLISMSHDERPGMPDGMKIDAQDNIWCTGPGGIWLISQQGQHLATVPLPGMVATNFCFGGRLGREVFFTTHDSVGRFEARVAGAVHPRRHVDAP